MKAQKWNMIVLGMTLAVLTMVAVFIGVIDPFLHYGQGIALLEYPLKDERYQNDGIARHFEYDAIITGTSMCQNFKPSEFEELWGGQAIKIANSGASYHESNANIRRALDHQPEVKYVLCSMDGNRLNYPAMQDEYQGYPEYLYDDNPFNDVNYLLNKEVLPKGLAVINYTLAGNQTTTMDQYGSWGEYKSYGKDAVLSTFTLIEEQQEQYVLSQEDITQIEENIRENFLRTAEMYPDTTFYLFFPPYSICYWEALVRTQQLDSQLEAQKLALELLLTAPNIEVYDFSSRIDITANLDNYTDTLHYGPWINSEILQMIKAQEGRLTRDNYQDYYEQVQSIYESYDYSLYRAE